jgi:YidC/Oxa1 family membrane protein insertase
MRYNDTHMSSLFHTFVYVPLYNALVALISIGGWVDVGVAIVVLTILVKVALFPLSMKASRTQRLMKELEAPSKEIREKYKDNREEQGCRLLDLYREKGVNPFSSMVLIFIQLPVVLGLYFVFLNGGLPNIDISLLYSFVPHPENVRMMFLGLVDIGVRSYPLAILAGATQYLQVHFAMPPSAPRSDKATFQEDFARSLQMQMKYVLPVIVLFVAYATGAAVALYWVTSNTFAVGQELLVKRRMEAASNTNIKPL